MFSHNYRELNDRQSRYFNGQVVKTQLASTRQNFKVCNMPKLSLAKCCKMLQEIATIQKSKTMSPLNQRHKSKTLKWVRKYKKMHFSNVIFINNVILPWLNQISGPNARSPPTIVLQFEYVISKGSKGHVLASRH